MRKRNLFFSACVSILAVSCANNEGTDTTTVTDTVTNTVTDTVTNTVEVAAPVDSVAVASAYDAAHKKKMGKHKNPTKTKKGKKVRVDSHPPIQHHDALVTPPAPTPSATPSAPAEKEVVVVYDVEEYYYIPDEPATFPGGEQAFDKFLHDNLEYPDEAMDAMITGVVQTAFYLDAQGNVEKVEFPGKKLGFGLEDAVRRAVKSSPRWNPARHGGKAVKSKFVVPIDFELPK